MVGSSNPRGGGRARNSESLPVSDGVSLPLPKKKWSNLLPLFMAFVVIAEIAFLGRLDMSKNVSIVDSWTELLYKSKSLGLDSGRDDLGFMLPSPLPLPEPEPELEMDRNFASESESCEEWLEREDTVSYSRDFKKDPILVSCDEEEEWQHCSVGCKFSYNPGKKPDAGFDRPQKVGIAAVLRSMESAQYYPDNDLAEARRKYDIVMTTSLSSDIPVGYFSWAEYDIMAPVQPKTEKALAAAFISNCGARNFRLEALQRLEQVNIQIGSYGGCHNNRDGYGVRKVETLKRYKFSLAFENSNEEDYVTEKFFQSLVAGTIPVVVGAPNIQDFAPAPGSVLHIKQLSDVESVAKTMKYLDGDSVAFNRSIRWKYEGPSDSFKALLDMSAVHSSCRLCIHLATTIWGKEEKSLKKRPCKCVRGSDTVYHLYVRERGRFELQSIFLRSENITLESLESAVLSKFKSLNHVPIWKTERPESLKGGNELKIYRIYPVGMTQRQALYTFRFKGNADLKRHIETNPCTKFEVVFV